MRGRSVRVRMMGAVVAAGLALTFGAATLTAQSRVVGGTPAPVASWPTMAEVTFSGFLCGGTLIDPSWVLTAAHCTYDGTNTQVAAGAYTIRLGLTNRVKPEPTVQTRTVSQVVRNPGHSPGSFGNDVALLHLSSPAVLGPAVATMDLVSPTDGARWAAGATARIAGWGTLSSGATTLPPQLQQASLPIISDSACGSPGVYGSSFIPTQMICAGLLAGGVDTCQGDSGGPLAVDLPAGGRALVGATSWGSGCAMPNAPGVYTRLDSYRDFVYGQIGVAVPGPPTGVHVSLTAGGATVGWSPPGTDGGRPVTGYRVTTLVGGSAVASTVAPANATSIPLSGGAAPTGASFAVAAANARGFSAESVGGPPQAPAFSAVPAISGSARAGHTLHGSAGTVSDPAATRTFRWQECDAAGRGCADIPGATGPALELSTALVGHRLRLRVTATNAAGTAEAASAPTPPVAAPFHAALVRAPRWSVAGGRAVITLRVRAEAGAVVTVRVFGRGRGAPALVPGASRLGGTRPRGHGPGLTADLGPGGRYDLRIATAWRAPGPVRLVVTFTDGEGDTVALRPGVPAG